MTEEELRQLGRLFQVMEQLRAPGGCPWDREQTHQSLVPYLLEETYEAIEAVEEGSPEDLAEELGDLLVEVAMHSAIAAEAGTFDIGRVARAATEKMIRRHPHVFEAREEVAVDQVPSHWEELKRREKPGRESALDGIPRTLPALALAAAIQRRQAGAGQTSPGDPDPAQAALASLQELIDNGQVGESAEALFGELLLWVVALARQRAVDPEGALRRAAVARRSTVRRAELEVQGRSDRGESPSLTQA